MSEDKKKKLHTGRVLFDIYKRKRNDSLGQTSDSYYTSVNNFSPNSIKPLDSTVELDAVTLVRRQEQFDSLDSTIKKLQESLSEKDETITSLEIQNKVLREGGGDQLNNMMSDNERIHLMNQLDSKDKYIKQLSDSLQQRNEELKTSLSSEKDLTLEIQKLKQEIGLQTKQSESKLAESYNERVEYKAKVDILTNQIKDYSQLVESLKSSLESNRKTFDERCEKLEICKINASKEIRELMKQVEGLNHSIGYKEQELTQCRMELENLRATQEEQIVNMSKELEKKYNDNLSRVEQMYDEMMLEHIRSSGTKLNDITQDREYIQKQIASCRDAYQQDLNSFLERSKANEDQLKSELKKYKEAAEYYKQQVTEIENNLNEDINKIKYESELKLLSCKAELEAFKRSYDDEKTSFYTEQLNRLSLQLKDSALNEAQKEVEIESYKNELNNYYGQINNLSTELNLYKERYGQQEQHIFELESKLNQANAIILQLQAELNESKNNVTIHIHEIQKLKQQIKNHTEHFKHVANDLENSKLQHEKDISDLTSAIKKQQNCVTAYKMSLFDLLKGLKEIKSYIKNVILSEGEGTLVDETAVAEDNYENMTYEVVTGILQTTLREILELSQTVHYNSMQKSELMMREMKENMVTSTPNVKQTDGNDMDGWNCLKCLRLEKENEEKVSQLELLTANLRQMEYCLNVATEESRSFNEKCKILDSKITELENNKSYENTLIKENKGFKDQLQDLNNKNEKLEKLLNNSDLKEKSDVVKLQSELSTLQQSEQENKLKITNLQTKLNSVTKDYEELKDSLSSKKKELEHLQKESNKMSSENKLLQEKILSMQQKFNIFGIKTSNSVINGFLSEEKDHPQNNDCKIDNNVRNSESEKLSADASVDKFRFNRLQTLHLLSAGRSFDNNLNKTSLGAPSVYERIEDQLQLLDQMKVDMTYHMPTIPEEELDGDLQHNQCLRHEGGGDVLRWLALPLRCAPQVEMALRRLLSALLDEYTLYVKKLLLPLKEECVTLDFNLQKWLNSNIKRDVNTLEPANKDELNETKDDIPQDFDQENQLLDSFNSALENCLNSFLSLKKQLIKVHGAVLKVINVQKDEVRKASVIVELQEKVQHLQSEKCKLEKNHKSAIELFVKDHESELGLVNKLLTQVELSNPPTTVSQDCDAVRRQLEQKHQKDLEELRMYFERKCADLEKHYSEEIYSQSCKDSDGGSGSSSEIENMAELISTHDGGEHRVNGEDGLPEDSNKKVLELKEMLEKMQNSHMIELESVQSKFKEQLSEAICKFCKARNLMVGADHEEFEDSYSSIISSNDLELKMCQIQEEVRRDYENELEKIKANIVEQESKRRTEDINMIKSQLNEAHKIEIDKLWQTYSELADKEFKNSVMNVKKEVILSQELEEKDNIIKQLKSEHNDLLMKQKLWADQKQIEIKQIHNAHKKEIENLKEALEIEFSNRMKSASKNRNEEDSLKKQIELLKKENERLNSEKRDWQDGEILELTENVRKEILSSLEQQIMVMVASVEEGQERSEWPPELAALERQFTSKYQDQLAQLVEEHALEIAEIKADYNSKLTQLVKEYSIREAEEMPLTITTSSDSESDVNIQKLISERDNLRGLAQTLGRVVRELAQYISSCEDELNRSLVSRLINHKVDFEGESSESEDFSSPPGERKVHFAPDVTTIVSLTDEDCLLDVSADVSIYLRAELETCLERLRTEAATVLGLTQKENRRNTLLSAVEDRRLSSITRQLVEEKKAKEEANKKIKNLEEQLEKYEQELNDVHKELHDTKERMIKDKVSIETELAQRQAEAKVHKLDHLQEKARALIIEKGWVEGEGEGECPPPWLGLIELLCAEGDTLIEDAVRAKEELELQVEAADKQLRSTRAFLEEQAAEREQERDEFSREIARLTDQLRDRDKDWTSHKNFANEIDALEQQVKETTELLKDTEEKKEKVEKELKAAVDKIWVLRDIISELEVQVSEKCERERGMELRLAELECELETQARGQADLLAELRVMQATEVCGETLRPPSPLPMKTVRSQLKGMVKSMERQTRELETINIHTSCNSLSSPSEDVSIREQFEALHCHTPEDRTQAENSHSPSTGDVVAQLNDRLLRHWRATDNVVKQLRDRDMEIARLKTQLEETTAERDVVQSQSDRQLLQVAALRTRVEELRVRNEREMKANSAPLHQRIQELEGQVASLNDQLTDSQRKLAKSKQKLERAEVEIRNRELELGHLSEHQHDLAIKLQQDLKTMHAEKQHLQEVVEKYRKEENVSLPQLVEVMLAEKNADIDHLQRRVDELQKQHEEMKSKNQSQSQSKFRGYRVSFADDIAQSQLHEDEKARDVQHHYNTTNAKPYFSTPLSGIEDGNRLVPRVIVEDISKITEPSDPLESSPERAVKLESVLSKLKSELEQKTERLEACETQLSLLEEQLSNVRQVLEERDGELLTVRAELTEREEDVVRSRADFQALQLIMGGFQQKLQEAKTFAGNESDNESIESKNIKSNLEEQLKAEITCRQALQENIEKLERDKQNIISELALTKSKCKSLQDELEKSLCNAADFRAKIESLSLDLEASEKENKILNSNCQKLKKEMDSLSKKQKSELKNMLRRDSEEVIKLNNEIKNLRMNNCELQSSCEKLQQDLNEVGNNLDFLKELNVKDDKIQKLENDVKRLEEDNKALKDENIQTERSLNMKISELNILIVDLNKNLKSLEENNSEESSRDKQKFELLMKKYETLKREYDRQRRARRESEKKCSVLKDEIMKEKSFSAQLQSRPAQRNVPNLVITKANIVDISSSMSKLSNSLDNLTDEVQKELNKSAQLDQSLISGLQTKGAAAANTVSVPCKMCGSEAREQYLRSRLAELETNLNVEQVVVSELRSRLIEERQRYLDERARAHQLSQEVASLHVLNDQFQDRLNSVVHQLEQQSKFRQPKISTESKTNEIERLMDLLEEKEKKLDELLRERASQKSELSHLRKELSRRVAWTGSQGHGRGDSVPVKEAANKECAGIQTSLELNQPPLSEAIMQIDNLEKQLNSEESQRKALENKVKAMELAERSRHSRRKATEDQLRKMISEAEKAKRELEQECLGLRLKLRQRELQLSAHTAESPLALRLAEANMVVERLVGEKEDLNSANVILEEEKNILHKRIQELQGVVDGLRSQIETLRIRVIDGGVDNLNARFSEERSAWQEERRRLQAALNKARAAQAPVLPYADFNTTDILERYLRAENHRKALVWQKRFLEISLEGYQKERRTLANLGMCSLGPQSSQPLARHRFRVAANTVRAICRLQFLVERRRRTHANTCRLLNHAFNSARVIPLSAQNMTELQTLWRRPDNPASSCVGPGGLSQYLDRFNNLQDRIRDSLSS